MLGVFLATFVVAQLPVRLRTKLKVSISLRLMKCGTKLNGSARQVICQQNRVIARSIFENIRDYILGKPIKNRSIVKVLVMHTFNAPHFTDDNKARDFLEKL